jgi:hypothetical protein
LLEHGADVRAETNDGRSPLGWARQQEDRLRTDPGAWLQDFHKLAQPTAAVLRREQDTSPEGYLANRRALCDTLLQYGAA